MPAWSPRPLRCPNTRRTTTHCPTRNRSAAGMAPVAGGRGGEIVMTLTAKAMMVAAARTCANRRGSVGGTRGLLNRHMAMPGGEDAADCSGPRDVTAAEHIRTPTISTSNRRVLIGVALSEDGLVFEWLHAKGDTCRFAHRPIPTGSPVSSFGVSHADTTRWPRSSRSDRTGAGVERWSTRSSPASPRRVLDVAAGTAGVSIQLAQRTTGHSRRDRSD